MMYSYGPPVLQALSLQFEPLGKPLVWEDPLEKGMQGTSVFFPGEFHRQRSLVGYSPWGRRESDMTE